MGHFFLKLEVGKDIKTEGLLDREACGLKVEGRKDRKRKAKEIIRSGKND